MSRPLLVLLHRGAWEDRYQAVTVAVTAASLGEPVVLALFFDALRRWVDGRFDEGAPPPVTRPGLLSEAIADGRGLGLALVSCEAAVALAGVDAGLARARLDRIESLPAMWAWARDGRVLSF